MLHARTLTSVALLGFAVGALGCGTTPSPSGELPYMGDAAGTAAGDGALSPDTGVVTAGTGVATAGTGAVSDASTLDVDAGALTDAAALTDGALALDAGDADTELPVDASVAAKPPCMKQASQVVLLGDSYINWVSHTFPADLNSASGATYRNYAVGGYSMGSGGIGRIPPELDQALAADPDITTIVGTGGGNDVLVADTAMFPQAADCRNSASSVSISDCQKIVAMAIDAASRMLDKAAANGVKDVVYFFYPHVPEGTVIGGAHPNQILDYALPMVKDFCDGSYARTNGKLTCHFVDMVPVFEGHPDWFAATDIHPNSMGSAAMAKAVWKVMKDNCIAQPASSGCCEP
jgi:hypothetical protein